MASPAAAATASPGASLAAAADSTAGSSRPAVPSPSAVPTAGAAVKTPAKAASSPRAPASESVATVDQQDPNAAPPGATIIPPAGATSNGGQPDQYNSQIINYEANQQIPLNDMRLHSLQEFINEGVNGSPLGMDLQQGERTTDDGRRAIGLLVVSVAPGSPAAQAGLRSGHRAAHDLLEGAAVAASLVFPPAVLAVPVIETIQLGENYDLIIGVDGNRVTNYVDFEEQLRQAQPGETVYLNVLRDHKRLQLAVKVPGAAVSNVYP